MPRQYTPRVWLNCAQCGAPVSRKASAARRRSGAAYCDRRCKALGYRTAAVHQAERALGEPLKAGIERRLADGMFMRTIALACGFDESTLRAIMRDFGIRGRTTAEWVRLQWVDNPERRAAIGRQFSEHARANPENARARSIAANLKLQSTSPTSIERALITALDAAGIGYEFQYVVGAKFLCDFGFPEAMLIVEADGSYWHRTERQKKRDASKDAYLRACGFTVLRFTDQDITQRLESCLRQIQIHLAKPD